MGQNAIRHHQITHHILLGDDEMSFDDFLKKYDKFEIKNKPCGKYFGDNEKFRLWGWDKGHFGFEYFFTRGFKTSLDCKRCLIKIMGKDRFLQLRIDK
jgi:hypothetical protein